MPEDPSTAPPRAMRGAFPTTRWSLVRSVRDDDSRSKDALTELCRVYWPPIYAYARRSGRAADEAEDLTQGFFAKLLEKNYVAQADDRRGRFRTFLLSSFKHYLANEWDRAHAQKRGGGSTILSLDLEEAEGRLRIEPADTTTPEVLFARQWAETLLNRVFERLSQAEKGNAAGGSRFDRLKTCLTGAEPSVPYRALAAELGMTEAAIKVAVHRMRKRFAVLVREEVAETVDGPEAIDEEIRFLLEVLGQ